MRVKHLLTSVIVGLLLAGCAQPYSGSLADRPSPGQPGHGNAAPQLAYGLRALWGGLSTRGSRTPYYLALGDSLSQGIQPGPTGINEPTSRGYPDVLAAKVRTVMPGLRLVKLGCSGETTATMIHGGICHYQAGSQLAQATSFLRTHRGQVALVTIDIGANDPNSCVLGQPASHVFGCLSGRITQIQQNLTKIMAKLRSAAGPRVLFVGMNYYVPELALWHNSQTGKELAILTEGFAAGANKLLTRRYEHYGARVADVFGAFKSTDFGMASGRPHAKSTTTPPSVAAICALTWMCAPKPRGPNEHANDAGYRVIAKAFWRAIAA